MPAGSFHNQQMYCWPKSEEAVFLHLAHLAQFVPPLAIIKGNTEADEMESKTKVWFITRACCFLSAVFLVHNALEDSTWDFDRRVDTEVVLSEKGGGDQSVHVHSAHVPRSSERRGAEADSPAWLYPQAKVWHWQTQMGMRVKCAAEYPRCQQICKCPQA